MACLSFSILQKTKHGYSLLTLLVTLLYLLFASVYPHMYDVAFLYRHRY